MSPSPPFYDVADCVLMDAVKCSYSILRHCFSRNHRPDFAYLRFSQFVSALLATQNTFTTLILHISQIIRLSTLKKVGRIATWRIVAFMAHFKGVWYRPKSKNESGSACWHFISVHRKHAVIFIVSTCEPNPAITRTGFGHLAPKAFCNAFRVSVPAGNSGSTSTFCGTNLFLHNQVLFGCATLSAASTAREHFLNVANLKG